MVPLTMQKQLFLLELIPGQKKDVTTFGVKATVVTSANVSEELVYLVTKAVFENLMISKNNILHFLSYKRKI